MTATAPIAPGSHLRVIADSGVDTPTDSPFIGLVGTVCDEDGGAGVHLRFPNTPNLTGQYLFETFEVAPAGTGPCPDCSGTGRDKRRCGCKHGCARCDYTGRSVFGCKSCDGTGEAVQPATPVHVPA